MDLLTTKEKFDYNCRNGVLLNRDPLTDMYYLSESNGIFFGHSGIDQVGIEYIFEFYAKMIYELKKLEFLKPLRNKRGQFTKQQH